MQSDTVIIDVRNHYEAHIGRFIGIPRGKEEGREGRTEEWSPRVNMKVSKLSEYM